VDGNVLRVIARNYGGRYRYRKPPRETEISDLLRGVIPLQNPGDLISP
jgi:adenine-specific DNA glycosylase